MMIWVVILAGALFSSNAEASPFEVGIGLDLSTDLGDPGLQQGSSRMGFGPTLRAPVRWSAHEKASIRGDVYASVMGGQDRIEWTQYNGEVAYYSDDHWTLFTQLGTTIGPEIIPWPDLDIVPYAGASMGASWVRHWHSFDGNAAILLDPKENDLKRGSNIDPYTDQIAPVAGFHVGVRLAEILPFAIEAELGYNVAFLRAAPLKKARPELNAGRTAYGFNPVRLGVNAVLPL